jgi:hypothetical protein
VDPGKSQSQRRPRGVAIMGCNAANNTYLRLHYDDRGICRSYEMSIEATEWRLWRDGTPFPQRFTATIAEDGNSLAGRWEKAPDGRTWDDFELTCRRATEFR